MPNITYTNDDNGGGVAGTDDQTAAEVPVTPGGNLTSTNVQDALAELQAELDALGGVVGNYTGGEATLAALNALTDPDGGTPDAGDWAILTADDDGSEAGIYVHNGTDFGTTAVLEIPEPFIDTLTQAGQVLTFTNATGAAVRDVRTPTGSALPADDAASREFHLSGHAVLPDGMYRYDSTASQWVSL